jgi:endonuclease III
VVDARRRWVAPEPVHLRATLGLHRHGRADPTFRRTSDGVWRTTLTPDGPGTALLRQLDARTIEISAWGAGEEWILDAAPQWLGAVDDPSGFDVSDTPLRRAALRFAGWRVGRSLRLMEALVPAIIEQKVTGGEAARAWHWLLDRHGSPAPGPAPPGMRVVPSAREWAQVPSWDFHRAGLGPLRTQTLLRVAQRGDNLDRLVTDDVARAASALLSLPGIGDWTVAETLQRSMGAADLVSVNDLHLGRHVVWALTGEVVTRDRADERMLELLGPYRPHRFRVQRLAELGVAAPPRRGPRYAPLDHRHR